MTYGRQVSNAKVNIDGTSNLHDWTTEATSPVVRGTFRLVIMDRVYFSKLINHFLLKIIQTMKNIFLITAALLATTFSFSQNLTIQGEIQNPTGKSVYLFVPNEDRTTTFLDSAALDKDGKFKLQATIDQTIQAVFTDGNENAQLLVSPGDDVKMTLNTRFFDETMRFSGKGAEKYNALMSNYLINEAIALALFNSLENSDTAAVFKNFTSSYDDYLLLLADYKKTYPELDNYLSKTEAAADEYKAGMIKSYKSSKEFEIFVEGLKNTQIKDFKGVNLDGKALNLSDFKGKITVLDFWATWCGPCRAEFPAYKELEEKYGEEINFVSVGVYCKEEDWKKMAVDEGFRNNIFLSKEVEDQIKDLRVDFIPRYMVLDENHKILDGMAPRPSSGELQSYWK